MRFIASSQTLYKRLVPLGKVINHSTVLPILECFLVTLRKDSVTFAATNLETYLSVSIDVEAKSEGQCCIPAKELLSLLRATPDQPLIFRYVPASTGKEGQTIAAVMTITGDEFTVTMQAEDWANYPKAPATTPGAREAILPEDALDAMSKAVQFCSRDDLRPALTGVSLRDWSGNFTIAATDAQRMYWKRMPLPETLKGLDIILPSSSVKHLINCRVSKKKAEPKAAAEIDSTHFYCSYGMYRFSCRLIDAKFPRYEVVMLDESALITFMLTRKDVQRVLRMASPFTNKGTDMAKCSINSKTGTLHLEGDDTDYGLSFVGKLNASEFSKPLNYTVALCLGYLEQATKLHNDPYMSIQTTGLPTKAVVIDGCLLIMPLMLNEY